METKKWLFHLLILSFFLPTVVAAQPLTDYKDAQEAGYVSSKQSYKVYYPQGYKTPKEIKEEKAEKTAKVVSSTAATHHYYRVNPNGAVMYTGSLRANIDRIARQYGWNEVVWDVANDYEWVGTTHINGGSVMEIMQKVLKDYPLQAVFYQGNRVLLIQPRTLR